MLARCLTCVVLTAALAGPHAHAAEPFEETLRGIVGSGAEFALPPNTHVVMEVFHGRDPVPQEELDRLERLAPTDRNADHQLRLARSINELGGVAERIELFYADERTWRINTEELGYTALPYVDYARGADGPWMLNPGQLQIGPRRGGLPAVDQKFDVLKIHISRCFDWTSAVTRPDAKLEQVSVHGNRAEFRVALPDRAFTFTGAIQPAVAGFTAHFQPARFRVVDSTGNNLGENRYGDWRPNEHAGRVIAHEYVSTTPAGLAETRLSLLHVGPLSEDMAALTAAPSDPSGADPARGDYTYTSIYDVGGNTASLIDAQTGTILSSRAAGAYGRWTRIVIAALVLTVGALVALHVRRRL